METADLKTWLRTEALALGFARVGFASCEPFAAEGPRLAAWFAEGRGALLPYLDPAVLADPDKVMAGARTALVGFFPYARPEAVPGAAPGSLKLSRYLWGTDYHITLKGRLAGLLRAAQARCPGLEGRVCVDTAPLLERQLAARAGLGWQGKHTLLIAGKDGSWGFLGVLLLDVELDPDEPFGAAMRRADRGGDAERAEPAGGPPRTAPTEHCGTCTACLDACPTRALSPFKLDPNRCMTTYTIETEAEPPAEVAAAIAATGWAAGCDLCQEVCPWNRAPVWGDAALWGAPNRLHGEPAEALLLGAAQWRVRTRRTALRRVRDRHWRRNVGFVLGRP